MLEDYKAEVLFSVQLVRQKDFDSLDIVINRLKSYKSFSNISSIRFVNYIITLDVQRRMDLITQLKNAQHHKDIAKEITDDDLLGVEEHNGLLECNYIDVEEIAKEWVDIKHLEDTLV